MMNKFHQAAKLSYQFIMQQGVLSIKNGLCVYQSFINGKECGCAARPFLVSPLPAEITEIDNRKDGTAFSTLPSEFILPEYYDLVMIRFITHVLQSAHDGAYDFLDYKNMFISSVKYWNKNNSEEFQVDLSDIVS